MSFNCTFFVVNECLSLRFTAHWQVRYGHLEANNTYDYHIRQSLSPLYSLSRPRQQYFFQKHMVRVKIIIYAHTFAILLYSYFDVLTYCVIGISLRKTLRKCSNKCFLCICLTILMSKTQTVYNNYLLKSMIVYVWHCEFFPGVYLHVYSMRYGVYSNGENRKTIGVKWDTMLRWWKSWTFRKYRLCNSAVCNGKYYTQFWNRVICQPIEVSTPTIRSYG